MLFVWVAGCSPVGPDYTPPDISMDNDWHSPLKQGLTIEDDPETLSQWWSTFDDPVLTDLIERSVAGNLDLKKARSRVRQARAHRRISSASLFPSLDFSSASTWTRTGSDSGAESTTPPGFDNGAGTTSHLYSAGFDARWEKDIFGGIRRSIESSQASLEARQQDLYHALVSLTAEVALNYVEIRTYQRRLVTVQENLIAQTETHQLVLWQSQANLSDDLAVKQARYNLESTRSQIPSLETGLAGAMNRIAVLLGEQPGIVNNELQANKLIPNVPATIAVGVPADVIRRRPDVRMAERELAAQTANIGVATADLYPKLRLVGSISVNSDSFSRLVNNLTSVNDWTSSYGPGISWAIFDAGRIHQNIKVQTELQAQALFHYKSVILGAVEEVENSLTAFVNEHEKKTSLRKAVEAAEKAVELSELKYEAGLVDFSSVLDAQRSLLSFENQLAESHGAIAAHLIRLYKSLGGGWSPLLEKEQHNFIPSTQ